MAQHMFSYLDAKKSETVIPIVSVSSLPASQTGLGKDHFAHTIGLGVTHQHKNVTMQAAAFREGTTFSRKGSNTFAGGVHVHF